MINNQESSLSYKAGQLNMEEAIDLKSLLMFSQTTAGDPIQVKRI